jgi:lipopolysaccharide biosynthesis glycosyltransferase
MGFDPIMKQASSKNCILLAANSSYIEYAEYVAWQIRDACGWDVSILIASADALSENLKYDYAKILPIDVSGFIEKLPQNKRLKQYTYWRLPAFAEAAKKFDKILYLDTDFHVLGTEVMKLFDIDMKGAPLAAVRDVHQSIRPDRLPNEFKILDWDNAPYFNAGMLLIDGAQFREENMLSVLKKFALDYPHALTAHDQSLLNLVYYKNWLEISPVWNWQLSPRNCRIYSSFDVELVHLAGEIKPWSEKPGCFDEEFILKYRSFSKTQPDKYEATTSKMSTLKYILKNKWYLPKYRDWVDRFESKFDGTRIE